MRLTLNLHGIVAILLLVSMFVVAFVRRWDIPWIYFVASVAAYGIVGVFGNIGLEDSKNDTDRFLIIRTLVGSHLAFVILIIGLTFLPSSGIGEFFVTLGYFIASIAGGMGIAFLLLRVT